MVDDMAYDPQRKRLFFAGTLFIDVFQQSDPDHYVQIGHIPTSFRAKTAILVPELNHFYLAVSHTTRNRQPKYAFTTCFLK